MNPLIEYPHLFANGKFKAIFHSVGGDWHGTINSFDVDYMQIKVANTWGEYKELTLIARPLSDMTDEEKEKWKSFYHENHMDRIIPCYSKQTAYLLSIGVYPFDQSHFDDGTVIDIAEI